MDWYQLTVDQMETKRRNRELKWSYEEDRLVLKIKA